MINLYNQVPTVYTSASRDFQYLSWLINIVLNSVKHNVDDLYDLPNTKADPRLTELLAMTLGFKVKRNYDQKQLATIVSILPTLLKHKGTYTAVTLAGNALIRTSGSIGSFECSLKDNCLVIRLPQELVDTTLFMDLLPYILPAGLTCRVVRKTDSKRGLDDINVTHRSKLHATWHRDVEYDEDKQTTIGLANLFEAGVHEPIFSFHKDLSENDKTGELTHGLLDSSLIPVLDAPMSMPKTRSDKSNEAKTEGEQE